MPAVRIRFVLFLLYALGSGSLPVSGWRIHGPGERVGIQSF